MPPPKPQSLVFLVPGFPRDEADTQCLPAVQNYIRAFAAAYPEKQTHVLAFQYPRLHRRYRWHNVVVHALGGGNRRGARRLGTWARALASFHRLSRRTTVRALHSFWLSECTYVAQWLSTLYGVRHVASIGGQDARADNPYHRFLSYSKVVLTAGSSFAAETFTQHAGSLRPHVIPLGLDQDHLRHLEGPAVRPIDLLGVGSLVPLKNYRVFITLVEQLLPAFPRLTACLIGGGPEEKALRQLISDKGLSAHITMPGALPREEVLQHMLRSRVLVHTSQYESQGYVFLEALQTGLYVVCFDVGYTGTSDKTFRCTTEQEMLDQLRRLLNGPLTHDPVPVVTTHDTVEAFAPLYFG